MKLKQIDFFKNTKSQYGVLSAFSAGLQKALARQDVRTHDLDMDSLSQGEIVAKLAKNRPDCTAGFNVIMPKHSAIEPLGIPHLSLIVDCATYYPELLKTEHVVATFVEEDSCGFLKILGFPNVLFLPHAIDRELLAPKAQEEVKATKRDLDVVMCGSYYSSDEILTAWKELLSPSAVKQLMDMAEEVMASTHRTHLQAFVELVEQQGAFEKELLKKKIEYFDLMNSLELYIRSVDRVRHLQAIDGYDIHIFGAKAYEEGWKRELKGKKRLFFHPEVPHDELPKIFRRARVVLNSLPTIKRGFHERLLLALSQGASVLGNGNVYIESQFPESKALLNILPPNYAKANSLLADAFKDEEARLADVLFTHATIGEHHTWDQRAKTLLKKLPAILTEMQGKNKQVVPSFFTRKK